MLSHLKCHSPQARLWESKGGEARQSCHCSSTPGENPGRAEKITLYHSSAGLDEQRAKAGAQGITI